MRRRIRAWAAGLAALTLALSGCGLLDEGGLSAPDAPAGAETVKIGYLHTIAVDDKLTYGVTEGHFAEQGVNVEAIEFDTGIAVSQALVSGDIDVAIMGGVTSNFPAQGQGRIFMVNSFETATARLYVQGDSGIENVEDLRGKTLALTEGTTADVYLHAALEHAGVDRSDVDIVNATMPNALQAFVSGSVDAVALWVPYDLRLSEGVPDAREIDHAGNYPEAAVADGWIANNGWYEKNPDLVRSLIRGWLASNEAFRADDDALQTVLDASYAGQATLDDLEYQVRFQQDFSNEEWLEKYRNGEVLDVVGQAEQAFVELGGVPEFVPPEDFFDTAPFIETAEEYLDEQQ
ncbi:ABC transporter substrate-binding protein [Streptomyces sp. B6B3]|uniref:ABC transporter substrate-binding protein n=1 Tax=Streptomyces sp. B6B3 TaxID=3153570 RepID=UPI00325DAAE4